MWFRESARFHVYTFLPLLRFFCIIQQLGVIAAEYSYLEGYQNKPRPFTSATPTNTKANPNTKAKTASTTAASTNQAAAAGSSIAAESVGGAPAGSKGGFIDNILSQEWDISKDSPIITGKYSDNNEKSRPIVSNPPTSNIIDNAFTDMLGVASAACSVLTGTHNMMIQCFLISLIIHFYVFLYLFLDAYTKRKSRAQIDSEVSALMSEYWTTFATYGDPNGQPFPHSSAFGAAGDSSKNHTKKKEKKNVTDTIRNTGPSNGYVEGTRVDSQPWWPSLLGDLPKPEPPAASDIHSTNSEAINNQDDSQVDGTDRGIPADVDSIELTIDPTESILRDIEKDTSTPIIRSALGSGGTNYDNKWATAKIHPDKDDALLVEPKTSKGKPKATNTLKIDRKTDSVGESTTKRTSAFDILIELNTHKNQLHKYSLLNRVQFMHQMVFDEESSVNIIENDCICNQWNELGYRF